MHDPNAPALARLIRRQLLTADLETGFALLRSTTESHSLVERNFELRQIEEARLALQHARALYNDLPEPDARAFTDRIEDLERATDFAARYALRTAVTSILD